MNDTKIEVKESELRELIEANKTLQTRVALLEKNANIEEEESKRPLRRPTVRRAHLRMVDGKTVVGFVNHGTASRERFVYDRQDPQNTKETVQWVDIILEDGKTMPVKYVEFLEESERVLCTIVDTKEIPWEIEHGVTTVKEVNSEGIQADTGIETPLLVEGKNFIHTLELPDKRKISVDGRYCNM